MDFSLEEVFTLIGINQKELIIHYSFSVFYTGVFPLNGRSVFAIASPLRMHSGLEGHSGEE